jgi:hypothetical protein
MIYAFAESWVSKNVHNAPGVESVADEVARLRPGFIAAARARGISLEALDEAVGDIDDYLTNAYENVHDPEAGHRG